MRLYYYRDSVGNFGDDLNPWLWPQLVPGIFDEDDGTLFVGIGTLLNHRLPAASPKVVLGAGHGYGRPPAIDDTWRIYCVRGPLTARLLGLEARLAATDPAVLVRTLPLPEERRRYRLSFMPHHASIKSMNWRVLCRMAGIHYIDPRAPVETTLREIRRSELLVTECLHGAIAADAWRVPWIPVRFYDFILELKWQDWCASLGLEYRPFGPKRLFNFRPDLRSRAERKVKPFALVLGFWKLAAEVEPCLSADAAIDRETARLQEAVSRMGRDHLERRLAGVPSPG